MLWAALVFLLVIAPDDEPGEVAPLPEWAEQPEWYLQLDTETHTALGSAHYPPRGNWHTSWVVYRIPREEPMRRDSGMFLELEIGRKNGAWLIVALGWEDESSEVYAKGWLVVLSQGYAAFRVWTEPESVAWERAWNAALIEQRAPNG